MRRCNLSLSLEVAMPEEEAFHSRLSFLCKDNQYILAVKSRLDADRTSCDSLNTPQCLVLGDCGSGPAKTRRAPSRRCRDEKSRLLGLWHVR